MGITRLNHAVLFVNDIERSVAFYTDVLGFRRIDMTPEGFSGAAFLQAPGSTNDHDLGLFAIGGHAGPSEAGRATVGLYHLAWEIDTLAEMRQLATSLPTTAPSPARRTTARQRASTARTRTGWNSRSPGSCRPIGWTTRRGRPASGLGASTSTRRSPATAPTPLVGSGSPSRSPDITGCVSHPASGGRSHPPPDASGDRIAEMSSDDQRVAVDEPLRPRGYGRGSLPSCAWITE